MAFRYYLVPLVGPSVGKPGGPTSRWPKYIQDLPIPRWSVKDFGMEPLALCRADVTALQHATVSAMADTFSFPENLSANLTAGDLTAIDAFFGPRSVPTGFTTADTWQQVVNQTVRVFFFASGLLGRGQRMLPAGTTKDTSWASIPAALRAALSGTADDFGIAKSQMRAGSTYETVLRDVANQFAGRNRIKFGGVDY